jgi:hypothetical protein
MNNAAKVLIELCLKYVILVINNPLFYLFSAIINITIVEQILVLNESSSSVSHEIYHYDLLGYSIAGLLLFIFSSYLNFRKIKIFSLLIYIICTFNIGFFEFSGIVQKIYPIIYSGTNLLIITTLLCYIFDNNQIKREYLLSFFLLSWSIAYFLAHLILSYKSFKVISLIEPVNQSHWTCSTKRRSFKLSKLQNLYMFNVVCSIVLQFFPIFSLVPDATSSDSSITMLYMFGFQLIKDGNDSILCLCWCQC